jgi:endonuclease/exonuclease/phosphatase family metal-dependent hydrolase
MRVMTFNLRLATPLDGANEWQYRKELVVETILTYQPELLGTQEGTVPQLEYLTEHLAGYRPLVAHRETDPTCQYPTIFYRPEAFRVKESGEFWLSETPTVHRSKSWDSAFPRMVTYGLFKEVHRELWFYFINTHLDHVSKLARLNGARMICEHFLAQQRPLILAGDFNEPPDSQVYQQFVGGGRPFQDSWRALTPPRGEATTQHGFDGQPRGNGFRIDWILVTPPFVVRNAQIVTYHRTGRYPSDHFPYLTEVSY